jgi:hypothetical protein
VIRNSHVASNSAAYNPDIAGQLSSGT